MLKIVLASQSPRRRKLLNLLGIEFDIIPSYAEEIITSSDPIKVVEEISMQKTDEVSSRLSNGLVIGADTIVVFDGQILGKPNSPENAREMLALLSGNTHSVFTGVSVIKKENNALKYTHSFCVETKVTFSSLTTGEIDAYIETGSPMDKAGAYGIQDDWGAVFVERIEGDFYNVVGFPLNRFYQEMMNLEPSLFDQKETVN